MPLSLGEIVLLKFGFAATVNPSIIDVPELAARTPTTELARVPALRTTAVHMDAVSPRQHRRPRIDPDFFGLRFDAKDAVDEVEQFVVALPRMCLDRPTSPVVVVARRPSLLPSTSFSLRFWFFKKNGKIEPRGVGCTTTTTTEEEEERLEGNKRVRGDAADGDDDEDNARVRERARERGRARDVSLGEHGDAVLDGWDRSSTPAGGAVGTREARAGASESCARSNRRERENRWKRGVGDEYERGDGV